MGRFHRRLTGWLWGRVAILAVALIVGWITNSFYTGLTVAVIMVFGIALGTLFLAGWLKWRMAKRFISPNGLVITTRQVMEDGWPILLVTHDDEEPRGWQFVNGHGDTDDPGNGIPVHVQHVLDLDPSVGKLSDLPAGWRARRESAGGEWTREPYRD